MCLNPAAGSDRVVNIGSGVIKSWSSISRSTVDGAYRFITHLGSNHSPRFLIERPSAKNTPLALAFYLRVPLFLWSKHAVHVTVDLCLGTFRALTPGLFCYNAPAQRAHKWDKILWKWIFNVKIII
jgi:hypothetical protein